MPWDGQQKTGGRAVMVVLLAGEDLAPAKGGNAASPDGTSLLHLFEKGSNLVTEAGYRGLSKAAPAGKGAAPHFADQSGPSRGSHYTL